MTNCVYAAQRLSRRSGINVCVFRFCKVEGVRSVEGIDDWESKYVLGHSGVGGIWTLVNALEPSLDLKTKNISEQSKQGQHTTTFPEMYDLSFNVSIIDTPGIKGFGIVDMEPQEIVSDYFPEFFVILKEQCKFNNCLHKEEPHCAYERRLWKRWELLGSRYNSYLKILEGDD